MRAAGAPEDAGHLTAAAAAALVAAATLHLFLLWPYTRLDHQDFDALHLFFPLAAELAGKGVAFLAEERSTQAPLFAYLYPALFGRSLPVIKAANALLSLLTLFLVFRTAWLAHSRVAGLAAAFLFALSPTLRPFLATAITEPPYLLLNALWIWGLAEWIVAGRRWALAASAAALTLAALTRASIFYWIPVLVAAFAWLSWRAPGERRRIARGALAASAAALVLPLAIAAKNLHYFGFPFFTAGAANALYLGNNPVTGGYDPVYVGLGFDVGSVARDQSSLTLEAERLLNGVARLMIADQDPAFLAGMHARKLAAFMFVTSAEAEAPLWRAWRIAMLLLAAAGAWAVRETWLRWLLVGVLAYQVAALAPMLYTHRYSVGAVDLWLVLLAGVGVASLRDRPRVAAATALSIAAAIAAGEYARRELGPPQPDVFRAARLRLFEAGPVRHAFGPGAAPLEVRVERPRHPFHPWFNYTVVIEASLAGDARTCGPLLVAYRREADPEFSAPVPRRLAAGEASRVQVGSVPLRLDADGTLRLDMRCSAPATLDVRTLTVFSPIGGIDYRERYLGEKPLFPALER